MSLFTSKICERGIARVVLNRPEIHNAFNDELISSLTKHFNELQDNEDVRLITLSGEGKSFCAGADLNWMKSMAKYSKEENYNDSQNLFGLFKAINDCTKPVLGKINGHALGGGVGLVSVCDFALSHEKAKFGFTEVRLGLVPAVISPFCINKIGESQARAWFLSGEIFTADKALKMGLIHDVVSVEEFDSRFEEVVESFLKAGPIAAREAKSLIKSVLDLEGEGLNHYTCEKIANLRVSAEGQEGMTALLEKRKAKWMENENK